jgi:uncharacterized membrane protein YphA (DoxX/SURF4 family)
MVERAGKFAGFSAEQAEQAQAKLAELIESLEKLLNADETKEKIDEYVEKLEKWKLQDGVQTIDFERAEHAKLTQEVAVLRGELTGPVENWTRELEAYLVDLFSPEALSRSDTWYWRLAPADTHPWDELDQLDLVNIITMWGLTIFGGLMVLGLFSRLASLGAAGLLLMFYLSMPPFPGLPAPPVAEGEYLFVNKNLIEMLACLMLATMPTGVWGGLDAFIRGLITRPLFKVGARELSGGDEGDGGRPAGKPRSPFDR